MEGYAPDYASHYGRREEGLKVGYGEGLSSRRGKGENKSMGRERGMGADGPVEPGDARRHGNDPDAVRLNEGDAGAGMRTEGDGPRAGRDLREQRDQAGSGAGGRDADGWNLPTKYLPGVESRDLPEPLSLRKIVGASVIILATALGSGELIIWPYITSQVGIGLLWLAMVGFTMQYFLNMEIERYTLATGETAVTGFTRFWKPWGMIFVLGAILPNAWPGWATGGATLLSYVFGLAEGAVPVLAAIALVAFALALTLSPVVYQVLEKIQMVLVAVIVVFLVMAIVVATDLGVWTGIVTQAPSGVANFPSFLGQLGIATLLGAIAFAGAGGANNLTQSNYVRDKGLAMGQRMPKVVSPITGEEEARASLGYTFPTTEENMRRWRGWWKVANQEQILVFYIIGVLTLIGLSVLTFTALGRETGVEGDFTFLQRVAAGLGDRIGTWFQYFYLIAGTVILFSTSLGVMDYVARLTASELKVSYFRRSERVTESRIYFAAAWLIAILGSLILLAGFQQPLVLLIISASGGGVVMALYSVMLIVLNTRALPQPIRLKGWRLYVMAVTAVFFLFFSVLLVYDVFMTNLLGG